MLLLYIFLLLVSIHEKSSTWSSYYVGAAAAGRTTTRQTQPVVELVGPKNFVALGGNDLRIGYRVSSTPVLSDQTTLPALEDLSIQLTLLGEDGDESWVATQKLPAPLKTTWQEAVFECGLVVRGGIYNIRLIGGNGFGNDYDYDGTRKRRTSTSSSNLGRTVDILSNLTIITLYPTIDFEVPHRLETYTTSVPVSFGLTRSLCKPKLPLPPTRLVLTICKQPDGKECFRDFATILEEPLLRLEREGQVSVMIDCHLWSRNSSYRVQIQEKSSIRNVIATSQPIKVEWSPGFAINFSDKRKSIIPCRDSVQAVVSYPPCILPGKDKIRVYGYESLPVPSFLAPKRFNYISEKQILPNEQRITFPCSMFPQRFSRYCFQYINTAEDDSVAIVVENCIPTFTQDTFTDGGWGPWSSWSPCSATCGAEGKRFRYRFCDSPSPSFGANVCQGNFIEEEGCDGLPECPSQVSIPMRTGLRTRTQNRAELRKRRLESRLQFLNGNVRSTPGCECGCLLYDLVPGFNYSLSVALSSNQSSCADEDEEEHHNLKWVLHASGDENRIRFMVIQVDVQCVTLSFRDGNTTDSNLLEMITMSTEAEAEGGVRNKARTVAPGSFEDEEDEEEDLEEEEEDDEGNEGRRRGVVVQSIESTGASLSIAATESSQNCSTPFVYFIASYHIVPGSTTPPQEYKKTSLLEWNSYEFWTFIFLKFILTFFILIVLCSTFGGCATKVYHKYKYKELKWGDGDEDEMIGLSGPLDGEYDQNGEVYMAPDPRTASRNTSITLMSFDYAYWKQMQMLRLKYFLLRPKVRNQRTTKVRSFPTSPTRGRVGIKSKNSCPPGKNPLICPVSGSKSESNLSSSQREKEKEIGARVVEEEEMEEKKKVRVVGRGLSNCECIYRMKEESVKMERSQQSFKHTTGTNKCEERDSRNDKFRKERENLLKRKESEKRKKRRERQGYGDTEKKKGTSTRSGSASGIHSTSEGESRSASAMSQSSVSDEMIEKGDGRELRKSQLSLTRPPKTSPSLCDRERDDFDGDLDFEMDYYDYNVLNSGHIPGSFLGLEPAFVLWNSEMYPNHPEDEEENPPFPDESESIEMETTESPSTSASAAGLLHHNPRHTQNPRIQIHTKKYPPIFPHHSLSTRETSLDTLKFVDEEDGDCDEDDDDAATHVSDSIFDNENDNETYHHYSMLPTSPPNTTNATTTTTSTKTN